MAIGYGFNERVVQGISLVNSFIQGAGTVGTTAVSLSGTPTNIKWVVVESDHDNTGDIWVGNSSVANSGNNRGLRLAPGQNITLPVDDLTDVYVIGSASGQVYLYLAGIP